MIDQALNAETNSASPTLEEILSGKTAQTKAAAIGTEAESEQKTKADDTPAESDSDKEQEAAKPTVDPELEKLKSRLENTQKWGNSQRQATLKIINNLREKGLSDDEIAETVGGKEMFEAVLKGVPVDQELNNPMAVVEKAFQSQADLAAATLKEMGHTDEELKEFMAAFNALAYDQPEHRDEMYRRATSGEGSVAAYALKVGKEKVEEYRLANRIKTQGVKTFEQELRDKIKAEIMAEMEAQKSDLKAELGQSSGKPRLVGGQPTTPTNNNQTRDTFPAMKDIFGR